MQESDWAEFLEEPMTLTDAGKWFDPPRSRRALDRLVRRGVLRGWKDSSGRVVTNYTSLLGYASDPTSRGARLREPGAGTEPPEDDGPQKPNGGRIDALERVVADLATENAALRVEIEQLRSRNVTTR